MTNAKLADSLEDFLNSYKPVDPKNFLVLTLNVSAEEARQIIAALRQSSDQVLVPREPTEEMVNLLNYPGPRPPIREKDIRLIWAAMLATAEAGSAHD